MQKEVFNFYASLRQIFGVCPSCDEIFRVSDCKLYQKKKPLTDWKEKVDKEIARLDDLEVIIEDKIEHARDAARVVEEKKLTNSLKR